MNKIEESHRKYPELNSIICAILPLLVIVRFSKVSKNKAKVQEIKSERTAAFFFLLYSKNRPIKYNGLASQIRPSRNPPPKKCIQPKSKAEYEGYLTLPKY